MTPFKTSVRWWHDDDFFLLLVIHYLLLALFYNSLLPLTWPYQARWVYLWMSENTVEQFCSSRNLYLLLLVMAYKNQNYSTNLNVRFLAVTSGDIRILRANNILLYIQNIYTRTKSKPLIIYIILYYLFLLFYYVHKGKRNIILFNYIYQHKHWSNSSKIISLKKKKKNRRYVKK